MLCVGLEGRRGSGVDVSRGSQQHLVWFAEDVDARKSTSGIMANIPITFQSMKQKGGRYITATNVKQYGYLRYKERDTSINVEEGR